MADEAKITSVLQLAKFAVGDMAYWLVTYSECDDIENNLEPGDEWVFSESTHPKVVYERNIIKGAWPSRVKPPRLHAADFQPLMDLLTRDLVVDTFKVDKIVRCPNTGEFLYRNPENEWMPESCLFDTPKAARKERTRIKRMIQGWLKRAHRDRAR